MALNDILEAAFRGEQSANRRMAQMPMIQQADTSSIPGPIMPFAQDTPESGQSRTLATLLPALLSGGQGGGRGNRGGGGGGAPSGMLSPGEGGSVADAQRIAEWIQSRPGVQFSIGGLENYGGTGQVSSGHIDNSQHYTGHAGDVSWVGGPRFEGEMQALDWLNRKLQNRFGDVLTELIWRAPDHYDHLHYGTRPGG